MSDGAHLGVSANEALAAVIGGETPTTTRNPVEMRAYLLAVECSDNFDYETCAAYAARLILEAFIADPRLAALPADTKRDYSHGYGPGARVIQVGLYDVLKEQGVPIDQLGLSGFMWGWAVNAARYCVELEPVPNPAIIDIEVGS